MRIFISVPCTLSMAISMIAVFVDPLDRGAISVTAPEEKIVQQRRLWTRMLEAHWEKHAPVKRLERS